MLFVRDTGSRNGTLVDSAPIKEAMVKPGHTLTIGPLTFRADYEPADSFIQADDPATPETASGAVVTATVAQAAQATKPSDTPAAGELEFEEIGPDDDSGFGLPSQVDVKDEAADNAFAVDDDMAIDFDLDDAAAPPAAAAPAATDDVMSFDLLDEAGDNAPHDALPDLAPADDILAFTPAKPSASPAAAAPAEISLDDGDLGFEIADMPEPANPATEELDDLGFTLEDLQESPASPAADSTLDKEAEDELLSFELAEPEPEPEPEVKPAVAKAVAKKADNKVRLGEEKPSGADAGVSSFMKELGL